MNVYVLPADAYGCGHYRLIWPADILRKQGINIRVLPPNGKSGFEANVKHLPNGAQLLTGVRLPADADVIVVQRPAHPLQPQMADLIRQNGVALVVDMDDDMSTIHPQNRAFHMYRPHSKTPFAYKWATETCKRATLVTCSTKALLKTYARHGRGMVIDNFVPEAYLSMPREETGNFGWAGSIASHPNDPQVTRPAVQNLINDGYKFRIVGEAGNAIKEALGLQETPSATGSVGLMDWARTIAANLDVSMVPLAPTAFNTSKSRLKGIESMACGVPWVASPREEYRRLQKESGCGLLAETPKDWYASVKRLMDDEVLRKEYVEAGTAYMQTQTYEANAWLWAEAWAAALETERNGSRQIRGGTNPQPASRVS